jgi:putative endonuclease
MRDTSVNNRETGKSGENIAVDYLLSNGYSIVSCNYQSRLGEIDCIAKAPDSTLVFIEVKTVRNSALGNPFWRVTRAKQRKLALMARLYLADHAITHTPCRFDVIGITGKKVEHLKNAFLT